MRVPEILVIVAVILIVLYAFLGVPYKNYKFDQCIDSCAKDDYGCHRKCDNRYGKD